LRYAFWIAWRYLWSGGRKFGSFISWVSVLGMILGVCVLTVVISVMNGFEGELQDRLLGSVPHMIIEEPVSDEILEFVGSNSKVDQIHSFFIGEGMVTDGSFTQAVSIYGASEDWLSSNPRIGNSFRVGGLDALLTSEYGLAIGEPLAAAFGLNHGSQIELYVMEPTDYGIQPHIIEYSITGVFEVGAALDYSIVIVPLTSLTRTRPSYSGSLGYRVDVYDPMNVVELARELQIHFPEIDQSTWADAYGDLFSAIDLEKRIMFVMILMVVALASFNIISGQMMLVSEKQSEIAILQSLGATPMTIMKIFLIQGLLISIMGVIVGLSSGIILSAYVDPVFSWIEQLFGFNFLAGTYFQTVPSVIVGEDLLTIGLLSSLICLLASWFPARKAVTANPITGLHKA